MSSKSILVLSSLDVISVINAATKEGETEGPHHEYSGVVLNMIRSWESPVVYLRDRGFLPSDYEDTSKIKPNLDALMQRLERDKREAKNKPDKRVLPQKIGDVTKQKKSLGWEQLQILSTKLAGLKSKQDEREGREGREGQLMAMKRRLEQMMPGAGGRSHQHGFQGNVKLAPKERPKEYLQSYDEILQRMIEKTSPNSRRQPFSPHSPCQTANSKSAPGVLGAKEENPLTSVPTSLSTYRAHSSLPNPIDNSDIHMPKSSGLECQEGQGKEAGSDLKPGLAVPTFLNWDMKNGRLDHYSRSEKEAYLNKLLRAFGQRLDPKESPRPSENPGVFPKCTQNP